jgi:hypothetical protein
MVQKKVQELMEIIREPGLTLRYALSYAETVTSVFVFKNLIME